MISSAPVHLKLHEISKQMDKENILDGLKEVFGTVKPKLDVSKVTADSSLVRDLGMDSLSMLLMSLAIEQKFSMRFEAQKPFQTVGEVVDYIEKTVG